MSREKWVETLVVADPKMVKYHGQPNVENYVLTIMNMVRLPGVVSGRCKGGVWPRPHVGRTGSTLLSTGGDGGFPTGSPSLGESLD